MSSFRFQVRSKYHLCRGFTPERKMYEFQTNVISGRRPKGVTYLPESNFSYLFRYIMQNHYVLFDFLLIIDNNFLRMSLVPLVHRL